ncbi:hypothetical protein [Pontibacter actiniarum]|uniref:Uncharacterized protein n=1 Tax=Pontibacter actiniarum TaxID=323450 RepID=A0A1X9YR89_9BACT|nr:hypothetical protein [Pontibacter actiniarum]ARS35387.1 hypothetical protein CA264_08000 [Pontibacter actiniarum]
MLKTKNILWALCLPFFLAACNGNSEADAERDRAVADYRTFVTEFEQDSLSEVELRALHQSNEDDSRWETEKANLQEMYDEKREVIETNLEELDENQRAEVEELDQRYNNAMQQREQQYADASRRYTLRQELLGLEIKDDDMSDVTAENIAGVFDRFVSTMAGNTAQYEARDWNLIEGWWSSLNSRYRSLENQLPAAVKNDIQQAQNRYREMREEANIGNV